MSTVRLDNICYLRLIVDFCCVLSGFRGQNGGGGNVWLFDMYEAC